jgi:hypothetical protein
MAPDFLSSISAGTASVTPIPVVQGLPVGTKDATEKTSGLLL